MQPALDSIPVPNSFPGPNFPIKKKDWNNNNQKKETNKQIKKERRKEPLSTHRSAHKRTNRRDWESGWEVAVSVEGGGGGKMKWSNILGMSKYFAQRQQ